MAKAVAIKQPVMRNLEDNVGSSIPSPEDGLGSWGSFGPCLLHRDFHDRQLVCYTHFLKWMFQSETRGTRDSYFAAVERAILDDFQETGNL